MQYVSGRPDSAVRAYTEGMRVLLILLSCVFVVITSASADETASLSPEARAYLTALDAKISDLEKARTRDSQQFDEYSRLTKENLKKGNLVIDYTDRMEKNIRDMEDHEKQLSDLKLKRLEFVASQQSKKITNSETNASSAPVVQNQEEDAQATYDAAVALQARDPIKCRLLMSKSAKLGHILAQLQLGLMWYKGEGGAQSNPDAYYWFRKAAITNNPTAQHAVKLLETRMTAVEKVKAQQLIEDRGL